MKRIILVTAFIALFFLPVTGLAKMSPMTNCEMEAVSGRTGLSFGIDGIDLSIDYIAYGDSDGYPGDGSPAAGYLNINSLDMDINTSQSELTIDVATGAARSYLQIGLSPLNLAFNSVAPGAPSTDVFDFSTPTAGTTKWGWWSPNANTSGGTQDPENETPFNATDYNNVSADDTLYVQTDTGNDKTHRFAFTTDLGNNTVTQIYAKAVVYSEASVNQRLYIKNFDTGAYYELDLDTTQDTWYTLEGTINTSTRSYIDDATGEIWIMYWVADPGLFSRYMRTDYVRVEVTSYVPGFGGGIVYLNTNNAPGIGGNNLGSVEMAGTFNVEGKFQTWAH